MRPLPTLCLLVLGLAACSTAPTRGLLAQVDATPTGATTATTTPPSHGLDARSGAAALLELPAAARVRGRLDERRYANGWRQSVALDRTVLGGGWNELTVDIRTAPAGGRDGEIPMGKPTEQGVRQELTLRFPATQMRVIEKPMRNALGPFGLAVGAGPRGLRCAFAWQWVDDLRAIAVDAATTSAARGDEVPASIRLRVCRKGVTEEQFADWYSRLQAKQALDVERIIGAARSGEDAPVPAVEAKPPAPAPARKHKLARKPKAPAEPHFEQTTTVVRRAREAERAPRFDPGLPAQAYAGPSGAKTSAR